MLKLVQVLVVYVLRTGPSYTLKAGPSVFTVFPYFSVLFGYVLRHRCQFVPKKCFRKIVGNTKNEVFEKNCIFCFVFFMLLKEKQKHLKTKSKMEKGPTPPPKKKEAFLRWPSKNEKNICVRKGE